MFAQGNNCAELLRAAAYAAEKHRAGPHRKGADQAPYINHPLAVANLLAGEAGIQDIAVLQAALLHDVVEDTGTLNSELAALFGEEVARLVAEVSDDKSLPAEERKRLQIVDAPSRSWGASCIKAADKICNLREIVSAPPPWDLARKHAYFDHAAAVVRALTHVDEGLRKLFEAAFSLRSNLEGGAL